MISRLKSWLQRKVGRSIRLQLMFSFTLATTSIIIGLAYTFIQQQGKFLMEQDARHAENFAHSIAVSTTSWVIANDIIGLQEVVQSVSRQRSLEYAMVISSEGQVLASTQNENIGKYLNDPVSLGLLRSNFHETHILIDTADLVDAAAPVVAQNHVLGWVRVALNHKETSEAMYLVLYKTLLVGFIGIASILLIATWLARKIVGALEQLVEVANQVQEGQRGARSGLARPDEIGMLAIDIDSMLDALERSESDLSKANQVLLDSEERWRFALEGAGDGVWDWDIAGGEVKYSRRWKEMLGLKPDEVSPGIDEWKKRLHPDEAEHVLQELQLHLEGATLGYSSEHRISCADGNWKWVLDRGMVITRDQDQKPLRMIGTMSDISERKLSEAEVTRLAQAVEQSPTGILITNRDGELEFANQAHALITGYQFGPLYGKPMRLLFSSEMTDEEYGEVSMRLHAGKIWNGTLRDHHAKGHVIWVLISASPVYDIQGKISNYLIIKTDITAQKKSQLQLEQRDLALLRANSDLTRFAEVSAHHLMEPVRRLVSYSQMLRPHLVTSQNSDENDEAKLSLDAIEQSAMRLRTLVRDIQLYLAAAQPRADVQLEDANTALSAVQLRLASQIEERHAVIESEMLPAARIDRPRLTDLFSILLENALIHATPPDPQQTLRISIRGERSEGVSRYFVSDNGPGVPAEYQERIFGIFEHLGGARKSGTGIGLSIARRIVESCGGAIRIDPTAASGTTVVFELPDTRE